MIGRLCGPNGLFHAGSLWDYDSWQASAGTVKMAAFLPKQVDFYDHPAVLYLLFLNNILIAFEF